MEQTLTFTPPSKARCPDAHLPVAQSAGTVSGVSVKLIRGWKGSLEKSMAEICWGASRFCRWNSDTSLFTPLTSLDSLHLSSSMPYPFQHTRYLSFLQKIWLSRMCSTSYSSTPSQENTGCVRPNDDGSLSQYVLWEMTLSTGYGLSHLWSSFFIG